MALPAAWGDPSGVTAQQTQFIDAWEISLATNSLNTTFKINGIELGDNARDIASRMVYTEATDTIAINANITTDSLINGVLISDIVATNAALTLLQYPNAIYNPGTGIVLDGGEILFWPDLPD